jgi:hypothetical protein|tara:strand:+ start:585 stop:692 length:108 start_codon:yes stop_codon:yes gene_type:complete
MAILLYMKVIQPDISTRVDSSPHKQHSLKRQVLLS